jgi:hypothetical protein
MTDAELRKLRRQELLEILFEMRSELDKVKSENERLRKRLEENTDGELIALVRTSAERIEQLCRAQGINPAETSRSDERNGD